MLKREGLRLPMFILGAALTVLFAAGLLFDYQISCFLYSEVGTNVGNFFAAFGELPAFLAMQSAGLMLILRRGKTTKFQDIFLLLGGIAMMVQGVLAQILETCEDLPGLPVIDAILITAVLFAINSLLTVLFLRGVSREDVMRFVMTVLFVCVVSMISVYFIKIPWGRPRMYLLAAEPTVEFVPWYRPSTELRKQLVEQGMKVDAFRSFPSGHAVTAACSLLWTLFPFMHDSFKGKGWIMFLLSLTWTAVVTVSRLTMGAHFLTDVTFSWLFVWLLFMTSLLLFYRDSWIFRKLYKLFT